MNPTVRLLAGPLTIVMFAMVLWMGTETVVGETTDRRSYLIAADDLDGAAAWKQHGLSASQRDSIEQAFRWGIDNRFIPGGTLLIVHAGEIVMRQGFGVADIDNQTPFATDAPCRIASVSKPHTATTLAFLVDQGKLDWDDSVDRYLPEFSQLKLTDGTAVVRPPKVRELLSHTAGFEGNDTRRARASALENAKSLQEAGAAIAKAGLMTQPGTKYEYTGLGYMVAGRVAEVASGREFASLMKEVLFDPIGAATATFYCNATPELKARIPTAYNRSKNGFAKIVMPERGEANVPFPTPGGGLVSTIDDVGRMLLLHRNQGRIGDRALLREESLKALYRPQPATGRSGYGLGFNIIKSNADRVGTRIRHTGASGTFALLDFEKDLIVVMLSQVPSKETQPFTNRLVQAIDQVFLEGKRRLP